MFLSKSADIVYSDVNLFYVQQCRVSRGLSNAPMSAAQHCNAILWVLQLRGCLEASRLVSLFQPIDNFARIIVSAYPYHQDVFLKESQ
jgi:hypothetical protein